jgi:Fe/S biogenesis protein NfuA
MIRFTDEAQAKVREFIAQAGAPVDGLRVTAVPQGGRRLRYDLALVPEGGTQADDVTADAGGFTVMMDGATAEKVDEATVDWVSDFSGAGFRFDNPAEKTTWDDPVAQKVQQVLDERVAPSLASHGGWVELMSVEGDAAVIQFGGGCQGCGMSQVTLKDGIEAALLDAVPEISRVVDATDHAQGDNPYYAR